MELSHFVSMMQYEILKSFDFNKYLQDEIDPDPNQPIQLAMEAVEIDIPLTFNMSKKTVDKESIESEIKSGKVSTKTHLDLPFSKRVSDLKLKRVALHTKDSKLDKSKKVTQRAKMVKSENQKAKTVEEDDDTLREVIEVQVANPSSKRDEHFDPSLIGRIKVVIKPITK